MRAPSSASGANGPPRRAAATREVGVEPATEETKQRADPSYVHPSGERREPHKNSLQASTQRNDRDHE
ncbi:hypothetical protein, partial [Henriciella sp.]|uniref:hypothetical protein n=1 Tax=Henriciella sp. TaxID=1968823 RepID=UPI0025B9D1F9